MDAFNCIYNKHFWVIRISKEGKMEKHHDFPADGVPAEKAAEAALLRCYAVTLLRSPFPPAVRGGRR